MYRPRFKTGDIVQKRSGKVKFWGVIVSVYSLCKPGFEPESEDYRYDVMAIHPEFYGLIHIYSERDLELKI